MRLELPCRRRKLRRSEIEAQAIRPWLEIYKCFEMRVADWPLGRGKAILVVIYGELPVYGPLGICALAENEENLLMHP